MEKPILVTGAAGRVGAVGRRVTELLLRQGKAVRAMVRAEDERAQALRDMGAEVVVGDLLDLESMHRAIAGCETTYFGMSVSDAYLEATVNAAAVAKYHGVKAFINMSQRQNPLKRLFQEEMNMKFRTLLRGVFLAITGCAVGFGLLVASGQAQNTQSKVQRENTMNHTAATESKSDATGDAEGIRPFHVDIPEERLKDLRRRIAATQWPEQELVKDPSQGVQLGTMKKLADYWEKNYDWRKTEAKLNSYPQFVTSIDGLDIHFIHVRSKNPNALPVIITHGWPGSIIEQLKIIGPLTDPVKYGGKAEDSFDVVIPSLPGYGFSGKPTATGWDPQRVARAWAVLMNRLGYKRYVAQGGDWGNAVTEQMALQQPAGLIGIHTNMPATVPNEINAAALAGAPAPSGFSAEEKSAYDQLAFFYAHGLGYANEMANRPQTLYAIADSPIGLAAWIIDHDSQSYDLIARVFDGKSEGLTREDIVENITLYWLTNTAVSSARLYWESKLAFFAPKGIPIPTAVSSYPNEIYAAPRSWTEKAYPKLIYYNRLPKGTHFAAWEQPEFFVSELRASFKSLR